MFSENKKIMAAIDVGNSKIASMIAKVSPDGTINLLGVGNKASEGMQHGSITNVKAARAAIASSIYEAELAAGQNIDAVIVNISSHLIKTNLVKVTSKLNGKQVLSKNLEKAANATIRNIDLSKYEILDNSLLYHDLDNMENIKDPEFMFANTLTSYGSIVTVPVKFLINLSTCLLGCQLKASDFIIGSYASALVCASDEDRENGCIVVDIGGDLLEYITIKHNKIIDCGAIPIGGKAITKDIANYFSINFFEAERIKNLYSTLYDFAYDEERAIETSGASIEINKAMLNQVVRARFEEIISMFIDIIARKKINKECFSNIIFTGGGSNFAGIEDFIKNRFGIKIRKENPKYINISEDFDLNASFSTALGLIKYHAARYKNNDDDFSLKKVFSWLKQNF